MERKRPCNPSNPSLESPLLGPSSAAAWQLSAQRSLPVSAMTSFNNMALVQDDSWLESTSKLVHDIGIVSGGIHSVCVVEDAVNVGRVEMRIDMSRVRVSKDHEQSMFIARPNRVSTSFSSTSSASYWSTSIRSFSKKSISVSFRIWRAWVSERQNG